MDKVVGERKCRWIDGDGDDAVVGVGRAPAGIVVGRASERAVKAQLDADWLNRVNASGALSQDGSPDEREEEDEDAAQDGGWGRRTTR